METAHQELGQVHIQLLVGEQSSRLHCRLAQRIKRKAVKLVTFKLGTPGRNKPPRREIRSQSLNAHPMR
jgi:hypothetical protein